MSWCSVDITLDRLELMEVDLLLQLMRGMASKDLSFVLRPCLLLLVWITVRVWSMLKNFSM